jgi:hypothetical protein
MRMNLAGRLNSVEVRHGDVKQDEVGGMSPDQLDRLTAIGSLRDNFKANLPLQNLSRWLRRLTRTIQRKGCGEQGPVARLESLAVILNRNLRQLVSWRTRMKTDCGWAWREQL